MLPNELIILRLILAASLGSLVGLERERLDWAAGLRTHILVCLGSCLFMIVSSFGFADILAQQHIDLDPSRVAAQVASGIGFLGAGTILLRGEVIRGLTTAASLWAVAAVGLAVGGGLYVPAATATLLILVILAALKPLEKKFFGHHREQTVNLRILRNEISFQAIHAALERSGLRSQRFVVKPTEQPEEELIEISLFTDKPGNIGVLMDQLRLLPGIKQMGHAGGSGQHENGSSSSTMLKNKKH